MTGITFYYDTEAIGLNAADKRELEKYCRVLLRREDLDERLEMLRGAYEREEKERADLSVYASPPVNDVQEVGVFHLLTRSLFPQGQKEPLPAERVQIQRRRTRTLLPRHAEIRRGAPDLPPLSRRRARFDGGLEVHPHRITGKKRAGKKTDGKTEQNRAPERLSR